MRILPDRADTRVQAYPKILKPVVLVTVTKAGATSAANTKINLYRAWHVLIKGTRIIVECRHRQQRDHHQAESTAPIAAAAVTHSRQLVFGGTEYCRCTSLACCLLLDLHEPHETRAREYEKPLSMTVSENEPPCERGEAITN